MCSRCLSCSAKLLNEQLSKVVVVVCVFTKLLKLLTSLEAMSGYASKVLKLLCPMSKLSNLTKTRMVDSELLIRSLSGLAAVHCERTGS